MCTSDRENARVNKILKVLNFNPENQILEVCPVFLFSYLFCVIFCDKEMKLPASVSLFSVTLLILDILAVCVWGSVPGTKFSSHISLSSPGTSYSHGVGDPIFLSTRKKHTYRPGPKTLKRSPVRPRLHHFNGYPKSQPSIPFHNEDIHHQNSVSKIPWIQNNKDIDVQVLPLSPYKVDSADPESTWPYGLYLPAMSPPFNTQKGHIHNDIEHDIRNVLSWDLF